MKSLQNTFIVLFILTAIPLVMAFFTKKDYAVKREIVINKPQKEVFDYVKYIRNMDNYGIWTDLDPNMKRSYLGFDGTEGYIAAWESDNERIGKGEHKITKITENESILYEMRFFRPYKTVKPVYIKTQAISENQTQVQWGFSGKLDFPENLRLLFEDFEEDIGDDIALSLQNLKNIMESNKTSDVK